MEGVAFDIGAFGCRVQKALIKKAVMPHQHRASAAMLFDCLAHRFEHAFQGRFLGHGTPQRVVRVDAGEIQCRLFDIGPRERVHMKLDASGGAQIALGIHINQDGGNFQQRVGLGIEAPGFHINHYRQKAPKPQRQAGVLIIHDHSIRHTNPALPSATAARGGYATGKPAGATGAKVDQR